MKKYIYKISYALLFLLVVSCNDATEIVQLGELTEDVAFKNLQDVQTGLNGVYSAYSPDGGGNGTGDAIYYSAIFADNLKSGVASNGQGAQAYGHLIDITGSSVTEFIWPNRYLVIFRANVLLRAIDNITFTSEEQSEVNHIRAQILALRALAHFDLFQYYTVNYQDDASLAIINVDFVPAATDQFERNTVSETLAFIKSDLEMARSLVDDNNPAAANPVFINGDFIKALQVKVALLEGDFGANIMALINELLGNYPLANQIQYRNMFGDFDNTEIIFKLSRVVGDNGIGGLFYFNAVDPDDAYLEMSNQLYNELSELPNDIRLPTNVSNLSNFISTNNPDNLLLINKYPGSSAGGQVNDIKVMRSSELQLIRAEMQARNGDLSGAATSVRELRNIRTNSTVALPTYANLTEALTDILKERRKEFCIEGHRFLDLKRLGGELNIGINRLPVDSDSFSASSTLPANDIRFTLGIPQTELDANSAITQNPGY